MPGDGGGGGDEMALLVAASGWQMFGLQQLSGLSSLQRLCLGEHAAAHAVHNWTAGTPVAAALQGLRCGYRLLFVCECALGGGEGKGGTAGGGSFPTSAECRVVDRCY